jgi:hypothetical protein
MGFLVFVNICRLVKLHFFLVKTNLARKIFIFFTMPEEVLRIVRRALVIRDSVAVKQAVSHCFKCKFFE